ncbi:hypothetical protein [Nonomuraea dietziae]|uniref:hypothetical protein n=1 Tax=Nonomuraea dietziae TaxID=65515 RepID=UPI0031DF6ABB
MFNDFSLVSISVPLTATGSVARATRLSSVVIVVLVLASSGAPTKRGTASPAH